MIRSTNHLPLVTCLFLVGLLVAAGSSSAQEETMRRSSGAPHPELDGFDKYFALIGDGLWDPTTSDDEVPGCGTRPFRCDANYFQEVVLGRSPEEILEREQEAKDYFRERFGLDVDDPANAGRLIFEMFFQDPRNNYRVRSASEERVPSKGWKVQDGGWIVVVIDPTGFDLGGDFAGLRAEPFTLAVFGDYHITVSSRRRHRHRGHRNRDPIIIQYQSSIPTPAPGLGGLILQCELFNEEYGSGFGIGIGGGTNFGNLHKRNIRLIMTFPGLGDPIPEL